MAPGQESRSLVSGSEARPADVFIPALENGKDAALVDRSAQNHTTAVDTAYRRKIASAFQPCVDVNVAFIPLAEETFGGWHPEAINQLTRIGLAQARQTNTQKSQAINHIFSKRGKRRHKINAAAVALRNDKHQNNVNF